MMMTTMTPTMMPPTTPTTTTTPMTTTTPTMNIPTPLNIVMQIRLPGKILRKIEGIGTVS